MQKFKPVEMTDKLYLPVEEISKQGLPYHKQARLDAGMDDELMWEKISTQLTTSDPDIIELGEIMTNILIDNYLTHLEKYIAVNNIIKNKLN